MTALYTILHYIAFVKRDHLSRLYTISTRVATLLMTVGPSLFRNDQTCMITIASSKLRRRTLTSRCPSHTAYSSSPSPYNTRTVVSGESCFGRMSMLVRASSLANDESLNTTRSDFLVMAIANSCPTGIGSSINRCRARSSRSSTRLAISYQSGAGGWYQLFYLIGIGALLGGSSSGSRAGRLLFSFTFLNPSHA